MADFRIVVTVDSRRASNGTRRVRRELNNLEAGANRLNRALTATFAGISTVFAAREIIRLLDTYNQLENRLRVVTNSQGNLNAVFDELFGVAQRSRSSLEGTVELYSRLAISSKELGVNQQQLIQFTESLNKAIIVSGASYREANQGLIQLSQGLASGTLRGDELRSVLEQLPVVADVIAKELGVTRGELRKLGSEGKITARDIITAFQNAEEEINERFAKTVPTLGQAFQTLRNEVIRVVGEFDKANGITELLVRAILLLRDNFELLLNILAAVIPALAVRFVGGLVLAAGRAGVLRTAILALNLALSANPFIAVATALVFVIGLISQLSGDINVFGSDIITLNDSIKAAFQLGTEAVSGFVTTGLAALQTFGDFALGVINSVGDFFGVTFEDLGAVVKAFANSQIAIFATAYDTIVQVFSNLPAAFGNIARAAANALVSILQAAINGLIRAINALLSGINAAGEFVGIGSLLPEIGDADLSGLKFEYTEAGKELGSALASGAQENFNTDFVGNALGAIEQRAGEIAEARVARDAALEGGELDGSVVPPSTPSSGGGGGSSRNFNAILAGLRQENELLKVQGIERQILSEILDAEKTLKRDLTATEAKLIENLVREQALLEAKSDILEGLRGPEEEQQTRLAALNELYEEGALSIREYRDELNNLRVAATDNDNSLFGGLSNGIARVAQQANEFGSQISEFVVGAFDKAADAVVEFARTGKFSFRDFFGDLAAQLLKLSTNQLFAALLGGGGASFGGGGGFLSGLFGGGGGFGSVLGSLFGFANGGSFGVGGTGGTDSQLVAFKASPDERVDVLTPQQQRAQANAMSQSPEITVPPANLQVAVVLSDEDIENVFDGEAGDRLVLRGLERNPSTARKVVGA